MSTPFVILGVAATASDEEIKKAYLAQVRLHPPDRDPAGFQQIRAAYEAVRGEKERLRHELFHAELPVPHAVLEQALAGNQCKRPDTAALRRLLTAIVRDRIIPTT